MTFITRQSPVRAEPGRRRKMRRRKKKGAEDVESTHLDGAGSARGFGSAAAGPVPEAFFVAPRNAPRISQPAPGPPCPEGGAAGGILPLRHSVFLGEIRPHPRVGSPSGTLATGRGWGARALLAPTGTLGLGRARGRGTGVETSFFTPLFPCKQRCRQPWPPARCPAELPRSTSAGKAPGAAVPRPSPQQRVLFPSDG